jgi:uncharacterized membrane protein YfcA
MLTASDLLYSASGFGVGFLVGMTGVGGGALMTPLLILVFGTHPVTAVGTDLLYAAATKTAGSAVHGFARTVDWKIVALLALGSVPVSVLSLIVLSHLEIRSGAAGQLVATTLACALIVSALVLILRTRMITIYAKWVGELSPSQTAVGTVVMGAVLGFLVSVSSVGAGALGVTGLVLLYPRMPASRIVGTDIVHAVPLTLVAGVGYWFLGAIDWRLLGVLLIGSLPGIALGSYFSAQIPEPVLRIALSATLILVASRLLF